MRARSVNKHWNRQGTTTVEAAIVLPIFFVFMWGVLEIGHGLMIDHLLKGACRNAARHGSAEGVSSAEVEAKLRQYMSSALDTAALNITIKDASVFDTAGPYPETPEEWDELPDTEVDSMESRQLFMVHASVSFHDIAFLPLPFTEGVVLRSKAIMRHE